MTRRAHFDVGHEEKSFEKIGRIRHCVAIEPAPSSSEQDTHTLVSGLPARENSPRWGGMWVGGPEQQRKMLREGV